MAEFRRCAGAIVFNRHKKVLVCARIDYSDLRWQFPQGGIMDGESASEAAARELFEETSIRSVECVRTLDLPLRYLYPQSVQRHFLKKGRASKGQEMYFSLFYFFGQDNEINLATEEPEFRAYQWIDIDQALELIVPFKREVYQKAISLLKPELEKYQIPL